MENSRFIADAKHYLENAKGHALTDEQRREIVIELAGLLLSESRRIQTYSEKKIYAQLARLMEDPAGRAFVTNMTDQCFRSQSPARTADQLVYLLDKFKTPHFLGTIRKLQLMLFHLTGRPLAKLTVPMVKHMLRSEMDRVILPGEENKLILHMRSRRQEGISLNLNRIGEAILGEGEAQKRFKQYLSDLANPQVECISVKISTLYSQIHLLGWKEALDVLSKRLKELYRSAKSHLFKRPDGKLVPKFVYLDMEEYRDLHLTIELFMRVLEDAEFYQHSAGIVLQSYLPDSYLFQQDLTTWAMRRVANGGGAIKIRLVKGANLMMEKIEASLKGWEQAPYLKKAETDANYKRMVIYGCQPEHAKAVHIGIASHNLFDIAFSMLLRKEKAVEKYVGFEMLEGMADPMRRAVQSLTEEMLLYCPAATSEEFQYAVAYLMRRLDEVTSSENFLRYAFDLLPGTKEWRDQAESFSQAYYIINKIPYSPRRSQNRFTPPQRTDFESPFINEPETDWTLPQNRKWAESIMREWAEKKIDPIPLVLGESNTSFGIRMEKGIDPSFPNRELYHYALGGEEELELCLQTAIKGFNKWSELPLRRRLYLLEEVAYKLSRHRGDLIGAMVADTGKIVSEADVEVSEAIDFAAYYRRNVEEYHFMKDLRWHPKGPSLVAPPWNFPCSIPAGGILASLAAGNSVIFKPAPEAVLVGWQLVNIFWEAGIDKDVLQFFCCEDDPIGSKLVQDLRLSLVILTGATSTAKHLLKLRPGIDLIAETGGKNSMIITSMADRDLAIKDLIQSAFGHSGQKCSACSLAILENEVYEDSLFREHLRDAAASLKVGSQWDLATRINPLIRPPSPELLRGFTSLDEDEEWLLEPKVDAQNPQLWSPGIKLGVKPGSFTHQTELFGPVLGIMRAENLKQAIEFANSTRYGLTAGIHTLDDREQQLWKETIIAGNCYINRGITGAIVRRQPFGGCKESSFGLGAKAGGPNYVLQLMHSEQKELPKEKEPFNDAILLLNQQAVKENWPVQTLETWNASIGSYSFFWNHYFSKNHDPSQVLGQDNILSYVPHPHQVLRFQEGDTLCDIFRTIAAGLTCNAHFEISLSPNLKELLPQWEWMNQKNIAIAIEDEEQLLKHIIDGKIKRLRLISLPSQALLNITANAACNLIVSPVHSNGRIELLYFLREVSLSEDYHRYGYLGMPCPDKK